MKNITFAVATMAFAAQAAIAADPATINWSAVPVTQVGLLYPGQSSYEWVRSSAYINAVKLP